jgi:ABC-2 type transport system permease protein
MSPDFSKVSSTKALILLLDLKLADWFGALRGLRFPQVIRLLMSLITALVIAVVVYHFDLFLFQYLMGMEDLGKLVLARFFELAFLLFFTVLLLSTALTALSMLYREEELALLFSLPVSEGVIFTAKYLEVILYSSWALVVLTIPFILSYGVYFQVNWIAYFSLFAGLMLPLVLISGSIGVAAALLLRWLFGGIPKRKVFIWASITLGLVIAIFLLVIFTNKGVNQKGMFYLFTWLEAGRPQGATLVPHKLIARGFSSVLEARYDVLERIILTLLGLCALITLLTLDMGKVLYYRSYLAGSDRSLARRERQGLFRRTFPPFSWISPIYRALFRKDWLEFRRYPLQWGQVFLLAGFWAIYLANILNARRFFDVSDPFWKLLVYYANFCFSCYFTAALAGRFVFPLVSLEGQAIWILRSAPLAMESVLWSKFWSAFFPLFFFSGSMVFVGGLAAGIPLGLIEASVLVIFVVSLSMTALALGLGAVFADFSQRNPMKIANTPGGILCILLSLAFMVLITTIFAWPTYLYYKFTGYHHVFPLTEWITATIIILAMGIVMTILPLKLGLRALNADLKT